MTKDPVKIVEDCQNNNHCFHIMPYLCVTEPPKDVYQCCHCGELCYVSRTTRATDRWTYDPSEHGPYASDIITTWLNSHNEK